MERLLESKMPEEVNEVVDADGEESPWIFRCQRHPRQIVGFIRVEVAHAV
jgi:hypothetical protein